MIKLSKYCNDCDDIVYLDDSGYCVNCGKHADNMKLEFPSSLKDGAEQLLEDYDGDPLQDFNDTAQAMRADAIRPSVVHFKKSPYDVYIGRGSKWGNIYTHISNRKTKAEFIVASREEAIAKYREYILSNEKLLNDLHELKGKILGCWCAPKLCHGDVLAELVVSHCMY